MLDSIFLLEHRAAPKAPNADESFSLRCTGPSASAILSGYSTTRGIGRYQDGLLLGQFRHMFLFIALNQHSHDFHQ